MTIFQFSTTRQLADRIKERVASKLDVPQITDAAQSILKFPHRMCHSGMFEPNKRSLCIQWLPSLLFDASAHERNDKEFNVKISYGVPIAIFRDAAQMSIVLKKAPMILNELKLGSSLIITKRPEIDLEKLHLDLCQFPLKWLFYHEAGHIIERHHLLPHAANLVCRNGEGLGLFEMNNSGTVLSGKDAWVSHALEISADYQAIRMLIRHQVAQGENITELEIWTLVTSIACLYYRFYGAEYWNFDTEARGTHPNPIIRFRFMVSNLTSMLFDDTYRKAIPWAYNKDNVYDILRHALAFASSYWNDFNYQGNQIPRLLRDLNGDLSIHSPYLSVLDLTWKDLRPQIEKLIFPNIPTSPMDFLYSESKI